MARLYRRVGWIQHCDVIVFEKFCFQPPHENMKKEFSKIFIPESALKVAFSFTVFTGYVWTEGQSAKKKLRFQTKTDTGGRDLSAYI